MIVTNTETVPGKTIVEFYGMVSGSTVRAKHVGKDILASLKNLVGGELTSYTELLNEARQVRSGINNDVLLRHLGTRYCSNTSFSNISGSDFGLPHGLLVSRPPALSR